MSVSGSFWSIVVVLGPIVLAVVIGYAIWTRRKLTPGERAVQERRVDALYHDTPEEHRQTVAVAQAEERASRDGHPPR